MKLKEQFSGNGDVFERDENVGKVQYQLNVLQEIHTVNSFGKHEELEGLKNIVGRINSQDAMKFFGKDDLTLRLEDGRRINFFVRNSNGDIQCSGDFF